jgi:hypothetical protein
MSYLARGPGLNPGIDGKAIAAGRRRDVRDYAITLDEAAA